MARILRRNVFVENPSRRGFPESFVAGQELPDWAEKLLKDSDHLFTEEKEERPKETPRKAEHTEEKKEAPKELKTPARSASAATWRKFAAAAGVNVPKGASRDDIVERVLESVPDLDIED